MFWMAICTTRRLLRGKMRAIRKGDGMGYPKRLLDENEDVQNIYANDNLPEDLA